MTVGDGVRAAVAHVRTQADLRVKYPACACPPDLVGGIAHTATCHEPGKVKAMRDAADAALADLKTLTGGA